MLFPDHVFAGLQRNHYRCVVVDAPHKFVAGTKGRPQHYQRMTDVEIAALPVRDLLHPDGAWLFYWVISSKLCARPGSKTMLSAQQIAARWGMRYSSRAFVWIKLRLSLAYPLLVYPHPRELLHIGTGLTTRKNAEDCLLFRCGSPKRNSGGVEEVILSARREHSRKPDEAFRRIEQFCDGPRVELFSRERRPGWDSWGDQAGLFNREAA